MTKDKALRGLANTVTYIRTELLYWQESARIAGATEAEIARATRGQDAVGLADSPAAVRAATLAKCRAAIVDTFACDYPVYSPETASLFQAAFLSIPGTVVEMWPPAILDGRLRRMHAREREGLVTTDAPDDMPDAGREEERTAYSTWLATEMARASDPNGEYITVDRREPLR